MVEIRRQKLSLEYQITNKSSDNYYIHKELVERRQLDEMMNNGRKF
jgi:hypothetical protein